MASSRDRQRKLARAKLDRQLQRRASRERRRRRMTAGLGASLALVLILAGAGWLGGLFDHSAKSSTASADDCLWTPADPKANPSLKDVGTPPTKDLPTSGTRPLTITTNQGTPITVGLDLTGAACDSEDLVYLAQHKFFDNTQCTAITPEGALLCGDVAGNGQGGPAYTIFGDHIPDAPSPAPSGAPAAKPTAPTYPKGTVALVNNPQSTYGSQFLLFFKDFTTTKPQYAIVGSVTGGTDTLTKISTIPTVNNGSGAKVKPKDTVIMQSVTAGEVSGAAPVAPSASAQS